MAQIQGKLGFGLMRLPMCEGEIDIPQVKRMVDLFLERGFNYFDTAYTYHDQKSEDAAKQTLTSRHPRESFYLATKMPCWRADLKTPEECQEQFFTSLERCGVDYFDAYLLHNLGGPRTHWADDFGAWDFIAKMKAEGKARTVGFSWHDKAAPLEKVLDAHPEVDFVQLQINWADWNNAIHESRRCYEAAVKRGKKIVVMEPLRGGSLVNVPGEVRTVLAGANPSMSLPEWGLRFAAWLPNVSMVLSGMSDYDQLDENTRLMADAGPLSQAEATALEAARKTYEALPNIPCTACDYCTEECPAGVQIPGIMAALNTLDVYRDLRMAKANYEFRTRLGGHARECTECGACEDVCPQGIEIREQLKRADELLEEN